MAVGNYIDMRGNFKDLLAYKKSFDLAMDIFEISKKFPSEEKYSLTDQVRRSSRSVCSNIAESYRKRQYKAHFLLKISDADMENSETQVWLDFALHCKYIDTATHKKFFSKSQEIGRLLHHMLKYPEKYNNKT